MSSLILNVNNSNSGGNGGSDSRKTENEVASSQDSIVVSAAVRGSPSLEFKPEQPVESITSVASMDHDAAPVSAKIGLQPTSSVSHSINSSQSTPINSSAIPLTAQAKLDANPSNSSGKGSSATVVVAAPPATNTSSRVVGVTGASQVSTNSSATTVITAVPQVSVKPLPVTTLTPQLNPKLTQHTATKASNISISTSIQSPSIASNQNTTVIGQLRNNLHPPISFSAGTRPHQLTIPNVSPSKQSSPTPTITLSPIKPQSTQGATLVTAIQSSQNQQHPSGTVLVSNNVSGSGTTILATHRQLHTVTTQSHRQLQQTVVQQPSTITRVAPTLITGPGTQHHVVQHHPPPLRMVHLPTGAASVTGGAQNIATRITVSGSGNISSHVPPTTVSLPQSPAPIAIRHALPQSPLARSSPVSNAAVCSQLPKSPVRHLQPQLPQTPVASGANQATTLLTTSRSVHSAPPAHLSSASIITHHPQQSGSSTVNRTTLPLASVLASANQQRHLQQQLVTQRVLSTGPGGATATVVQGLQQPHAGITAHSLGQSATGTIMVNPHRPGTISMLPQVPASGTVTAGGLIVHHPSSGGSGTLLNNSSNTSQNHHNLSGGSHQLLSFPSNNSQSQTSINQRITLPSGNVLAQLNGSQHRGSILTVSGAATTSAGNNSSSMTSNIAGRQIIATSLAKSSTTILPPNAMQHLLASHPHPQQPEDDSETVDTEAQQLNSYHHHSQNSPVIGISRGGTSGVTINTGRTTVTLPSPRHQQQVQQRDRRSLPCQLALQDHNYYSRPPPTPPPPSQSPPILRDVLQERRHQVLHQSFNTNSTPFSNVLAAAEVHHQQLSPGTKSNYMVGSSISTDRHSSPSPATNISAFSPSLQTNTVRSSNTTIPQHAQIYTPGNNKMSGTSNSSSIVRLPQYTPDSQKFAAAMVAAVGSPSASSIRKHSKSSHTGLVSASNGPNSMDRMNSTTTAKNGVPFRTDAHFRSIQEAGVGPMAPLVDDMPSNDDNDNDEEGSGEETETAPEAEGEDDSITRCICDFLHDDGYMISCDKCLVWQHVVCMGLDRNNIPDEYLCEVCKPRPIDRKRAKSMQSRRRSELYHHSSSSDESSGNRNLKGKTKNKGILKMDKKNSTKTGLATMKKIFDKKIDRITNKDISNKRVFNSKILKKNAAQTLAMLNNKGINQHTGFPSSTMIPQQLLPANLLENTLNVLDDNDDNVLSPASPLNASSKLKKQYRKRKQSEKDLKKTSPLSSSAMTKNRRKSQQLKKQQNRSRQRSIDSDGADDVDNTTDEDEENQTIEETAPDASQQLRSWIDQYEEAVTNHYSPELRARLAGSGKWGGGVTNGDLRPSVIGSMTRCNVSLQGNGVKILTACSNLSSNTPVIECKGKLMLAAQYRSSNRKSPGQNSSPNISLNPYVFYYQLSGSLEICLDGKTYGNDSRFCRRSSNDYNAELRHVIDKGSLHLFIITIKSVDKNQEILLPPDSSYYLQDSTPLPSINADLREITMKSSKPATNGLLSPGTSPLSGKSSDLDEATPLSSTRIKQPEDNMGLPDSKVRINSKIVKEKRQFSKTLSNSPKKGKNVYSKENKASHNTPIKKKQPNRTADEVHNTGTNSKKLITNRHENTATESNSADETDHGQDSAPTSPTKYGSAKPSPGKLGLPDNSGLIVGVNTINYDASSELKNKAKSREERKMEMIMKAFEAMERAEQKKKEINTNDQSTSGVAGHQSVRGSTDSDKSTPANKRRRSSAKDIARANTDSNVDASSAEDMANDDTDDNEEDDNVPGGKKKADKLKTKKGFGRNNKNRKSTAPNTPKRRRSRISSGGSHSGAEDTASNHHRDNHDSRSANSTNLSSNAPNGPFRFPKTKKSMMSDWLHEANEASRSPNPAFCDDDDVSANYLKGSRSPPGIAMHLLRSSIGSNTPAAPLSPNITSPHSPVKVGNNPVCSAKKRWLRQAISEDHAPGEILSPAHEVALMMNGNSPVSSGEVGITGEPGNCSINDYVTPLKKRRLQNYKDEQRFLEEEANISSEDNITSSQTISSSSDLTTTMTSSFNSYSDDVKVLPNGIKKKLLHNLVLEAVLDRAMEDMLNVKPKNEINEPNAEIEVATVSNEINSVKNEVEGDGITVAKYDKNDTKNTFMSDNLNKNDSDQMKEDTYSNTEKERSNHHANIVNAGMHEVANNADATINTNYYVPDIRTGHFTSELSASSPSTNIPEPSSVFKSFFKSTVSIEDLEAQLEETRKLREAEQKQLEQLNAKQREEDMEKQKYGIPDTKWDEKYSNFTQDQNENDQNIKKEESLTESIITDVTANSSNKAELSRIATSNFHPNPSGELIPNTDEVKVEVKEQTPNICEEMKEEFKTGFNKNSDFKREDIVKPTDDYALADSVEYSSQNVSQVYMDFKLKQDENRNAEINQRETERNVPNLSNLEEICSSTTHDPPKPKEKRKFSLADYKRRRQQQQLPTHTNDSNAFASSAAKQSAMEIANSASIKTNHVAGVQVQPGSDNSLDSCSSILSCSESKPKEIPAVETKQINNPVKSVSNKSIDKMISVVGISDNHDVSDDYGAGTPTMDEDQITPATTVLPPSVVPNEISCLPPANAPITLNTLPLFEKLEKLEKAQKENKKKALGNVSPPPEPKREDLTERLKKEFGLTVDGDDDTPISEEEIKKVPTSSNSNFADGDATPEEDSPPPPSVASGSALSSTHRHPTMTRLPEQIAQYPTASASSLGTSATPSNVEGDSTLTPKGTYNSNYGQHPQSSRYQSQQTRSSSYQQSSTAYSQPTHHSYQRHPPPPSRSHLPVSHPGSRMTYPPPLPPASVIANAPHPNKVGSEREINIKSSSNSFKRCNSKDEYYSQQHNWPSERDNRSERDREQRNSSGGNRSYYASTTSRPMSERSNAGGRSNNSSANYGEKSSSRDYNRREYSQIRSDSSADRIGSRSSASLGTDRDLRGGGSEHGSSRSSGSTRSSKSSYSRSSYYNN